MQLHATSKNNPLTLTVNNDLSINASLEVNYTEKSWTTPGTYTWTVPAGVTRVRVAVCGGGSGGNAFQESKSGAGGTSSFGSLVKATGGTSCFIPNADMGWDYVDTPDDSNGGIGGTPNGRKGERGWNRTVFAGGTGFSLSFSMSNGNYGKGGDIPGSSYSCPCVAGGSGGYLSTYIEVTPKLKYTIIVGKGGTANGISNRRANNGNSGFVLIAYGKGV